MYLKLGAAAILTLGLAACTSITPTPQPTLPRPPTTTALAATALLTPTPTIAPTTKALTVNAVPLFQKGIKEAKERYQFAVQQGAQFIPTPDGKSFYVWWRNENANAPTLVTLHGHSSWAFDEFYLWHPYALQRGYNILALQWWFGGGETTADYYQPLEMYSIIATALHAQNIKAGTVLLHGFSRGATNTYGLTALDRAQQNNYFALTIANAGKAAPDYPINLDIMQGKFGAKPFTNTQWVLVCGAHDPNPDRDGCPAMTDTQQWLTRYGGLVDLFVQDPNGDHGAFHRNPNNVNATLNVFDKLVKSAR